MENWESIIPQRLENALEDVKRKDPFADCNF